ncbi:MAG: stress responsive protein [Rhizobium sp.]|nr:stress responsive protein [Rhizobium sp.]
MIKHIVMWNLSGSNVEEKRQAAKDVKTRFEGLAGQIPGLLNIEIGIDVSEASYACDVVLYSEFDSQASLAAYADHPAHLKVRNELKDVRIARYQVDYVPDRETASTLLQPWSESVAARK